MVLQYLPLKSQIQSVDTVSTWSSLNSGSSANCFDNIIVQPNEEPSLEVIFLLLQFVKINPNFKILFITKVCHTSNLDWFLCTNTAIMMTLKLAQQVGWWAGHLFLLHYHWGIIHTKISFKVFLLTNLKTPPPILSKYLCSSGLVSRQLA